MNRFDGIIAQDKYDSILKELKIIITRNSVRFQDIYPTAKTKNGVYGKTSYFFDGFLGGFWAGIFYLAYHVYGNEPFKCYGEILSEKFYNLISEKNIRHKEMGMVYIPICVEDIRINNNVEAAKAVMKAADYLIDVFNTDVTLPCNFQRISRLTNIMILYLAERISCNSKYTETAKIIEQKIISNNITADYDCIMCAATDEDNNIIYLPDDVCSYGYAGGCGYARPYAWAIHGLALLYSLTSDLYYENMVYNILKRFLDISCGKLNVFIAKNSRIEPKYDTTSLMIFLCGICEIIKKLDVDNVHYGFYYELLKNNMNLVADNFVCYASDNGQGLISGGIILEGLVDFEEKIECTSTILGDYFFLEAMLHISGDFHSCWDISNLCDRKDGFFQNEIKI